MKYMTLLLFTVITVSTACKDKKQNQATENNTETKMETSADPVKDSAGIRTVITDFYNWYAKEINYKKLQKFDLYSGTKKKDAPPYKINWEEVDKYQAFIRDSVPQLGEEFLKNQKILFTKADSAFKVDVNDEVPYYFDYDWYTNSQEDPQYLLDGINKSNKWVVIVKGDNATVEIGSPEDKNYISGSLLIQLDMQRENGNWKIAKIGND
ncbi:MAG: hypothetical protein ABIR30_03705 [Chitinophagaceae bacterium]